MKIALVLNQDDVFYSETLLEFLKTTPHALSCIIVVPSHSSPMMKKKYIRAATQMVSWTFIASVYGRFALQKTGSLFSKSLRLKTSLKAIAKEYRIPFFTEGNVNSESFRTILESHQITLVLSICSQIYKEKILSVPNLKILNFHAGLLPRNQGRFPIFWAIQNGDSAQGMTCHSIVRKIDEGPILFQRLFTQSPLSRETVESFMLQFQNNMPTYLNHAIDLVLENRKGEVYNHGLEPFYGPIPTSTQIAAYKASYRNK